MRFREVDDSTPEDHRITPGEVIIYEGQWYVAQEVGIRYIKATMVGSDAGRIFLIKKNRGTKSLIRKPKAGEKNPNIITPEGAVVKEIKGAAKIPGTEYLDRATPKK